MISPDEDPAGILEHAAVEGDVEEMAMDVDPALPPIDAVAVPPDAVRYDGREFYVEREAIAEGFTQL